MKSHRVVVYFTLLVIIAPNIVLAQGESAVPFLLISSSPEGNGMGGIIGSIPTDNAMAPIANPGQLGLLSLRHYISSATYTPQTRWLPQFQMDDLTYTASAINAGVNLQKFLPIPMPVSVGFGYSHIYLNLGSFAIASNDPAIIGTYHAFEKSDNYTVGIGVDYFVKIGFGYTSKKIESRIGSFMNREYTAKVTTYDLGVVAQVPIVDIMTKLRDEPITMFGKLNPLFDVTFGYSRNNLGDNLVYYIDQAQGDPLPRKPTMGLSWKFGCTTRRTSYDWEVFSFMLAREADDLLIQSEIVDPNTSMVISERKYTGGTGNIKFFKNLILGKRDHGVWLHKGWQLNFGEAIFFRGGSLDAPGLEYTTEGFGFRLSGFLKLVGTMYESNASSSLLDMAIRHLDVQFDHASESSPESPRSTTTYNGFNFIFQ